MEMHNTMENRRVHSLSLSLSFERSFSRLCSIIHVVSAFVLLSFVSFLLSIIFYDFERTVVSQLFLGFLVSQSGESSVWENPVVVFIFI